MNAMIRGLKGLLALGALGGIGLLLRWVTVDSIGSATTQDLPSMASLAVGSVAWVAYAWLLIAVMATVLEQVPGVVGRSASIVATRITSHGSRALLRSALGVAAVTPLTIGVAHATPGDGNQQQPWTSVEPLSTVQLTGTPSAWRATEPPSTLRLTSTRTALVSPSTRLRSAVPNKGAAGRTTTTPGEGTTGRTSVSEKPSALSLTGDSAIPAHPSTGLRGEPEPASGLRLTESAVPGEPGRARVSGPDQVAVPDRPTSGAATRYTDLETGRRVKPASHVVRPGDSLWSIAATELGPAATDEAIASRWPQWYAANRQLIGPDPDLILAGQVLRIPAPATFHPVPPTHQEK